MFKEKRYGVTLTNWYQCCLFIRFEHEIPRTKGKRYRATWVKSRQCCQFIFGHRFFHFSLKKKADSLVGCDYSFRHPPEGISSHRHGYGYICMYWIGHRTDRQNFKSITWKEEHKNHMMLSLPFPSYLSIAICPLSLLWILFIPILWNTHFKGKIDLEVQVCKTKKKTHM